MSESPPERTPSGGNILTRKIGPLPLWGWMGIGLVLALLYYFYSKNKSGTTASAASTSSTSTTSSSLIPEFVNQVYTNSSPPTGTKTHSGGGTETTGPTPTQLNTNQGVIVAVPNGTGGWMDVTFPNQNSLNNFYSAIGVTNGAYPNGLNNQQITSAINNAGGNVATNVYLGHQ